MKQLSTTEVNDWLTSQRWLGLRDPDCARFGLLESRGLTKFVATIAEDCTSVACEMADLFLHDIPEAEFRGGLFWIARPVFPSAVNWAIVEQIFRAGGISSRPETAEFFLLEPNDHSACIALVALMLMFRWDANLVLAGRRFLLEIDDEPFPSLITDQASDWFIEAARNLDFKISLLGTPPA